MTKELVVGGIFLTAVALVGYLTLQIQGFEKGGDYEIVHGLEIDGASQQRMDDTERELFEERSAIAELLPS